MVTEVTEVMKPITSCVELVGRGALASLQADCEVRAGIQVFEAVLRRKGVSSASLRDVWSRGGWVD